MTTEIISFSIPVERETGLHIQPVMKCSWLSQCYVYVSKGTHRLTDAYMSGVSQTHAAHPSQLLLPSNWADPWHRAV